MKNHNLLHLVLTSIRNSALVKTWLLFTLQLLKTEVSATSNRIAIGMDKAKFSVMVTFCNSKYPFVVTTNTPASTAKLLVNIQL